MSTFDITKWVHALMLYLHTSHTYRKNLNIRYLNCTSKVEMLSIHDIHQSRKCVLNLLRFYFNFQLVCFFLFYHLRYAVVAGLVYTHTYTHTRAHNKITPYQSPLSLDPTITFPRQFLLYLYFTVDFCSIYRYRARQKQ